MKPFIFAIICVLCYACKQETFEKIDANEVAEEEFKSLNLKQVDQFPLFKTCDENDTAQDQKKCFETKIHAWLKPHVDSLKYNTSKGDTIHLYLKINTNGDLVLDSLKSKLDIKQQFDSIFLDAPKFYPAQKRGVPVQVSFELPLILKVNQTL